jgi:thioredoxin-like negative regulator of GroEL
MDRCHAAAVAAWQRSIELDVSPWALRNLAVAEFGCGHVREAAELLTAAAWSTPAVPDLSVEAVDLLLAAGQADEAATLLRRVPG